MQNKKVFKEIIGIKYRINAKDIFAAMIIQGNFEKGIIVGNTGINNIECVELFNGNEYKVDVSLNEFLIYSTIEIELTFGVNLEQKDCKKEFLEYFEDKKNNMKEISIDSQFVDVKLIFQDIIEERLE